MVVINSGDGGLTWSHPARVNDDDVSRDIDQLHPALAVDPHGKVWAAFYDSRRDLRNYLTDVFAASSTNGGRTFANQPLTTRPYARAYAADAYAEDPNLAEPDDPPHLVAATDGLGRAGGVIVAWDDDSQGDPNIYAVRR